MIKKLKSLWKKAADTPVAGKGHQVSLAVAALMVEVMRMDGKLEQAERQEITQLLSKRFDLKPTEITALIEQAEETTEAALDIHQFTSVVVKGFSTQERIGIVKELWAVAMADGHIDPHEEHIIRRMADLMGLHHTQFIEAKITAGAA